MVASHPSGLLRVDLGDDRRPDQVGASGGGGGHVQLDDVACFDVEGIEGGDPIRAIRIGVVHREGIADVRSRATTRDAPELGCGRTCGAASANIHHARLKASAAGNQVAPDLADSDGGLQVGWG